MTYVTLAQPGVAAQRMRQVASDGKSHCLHLVLEPVPTLSEAEVEQWTRTHTPDDERTCEHFEQDGTREECVQVSGGLFWRHFHHVTVPNVVLRRWRVREWLLPDGRVVAVKDEP